MSRWLAQWGLREAPFTKEIGDGELWVPASRVGAVDRLVEDLAERTAESLIKGDAAR